MARVANTELTAAQLDARLGRLPPNVDKRDPAVLKLVLKGFIDETLLAQAAEKDKLDKRPSVVRDIETSRNVVLANAYLSRNITSRPPNEAAIRRYYNDNPAIFSNRRAYRLTDVTVRESQPQSGMVIAEMRRRGATVESVLNVAREHSVVPDSSSGVDAGENLPSKLARVLTNMGVGDVVNYRVAETQHFTRLDAVTDAPQSFEATHDLIGGLLLNQAREAAVEAKLNQLRAVTAIEYGTVGRAIQAGHISAAVRSKAQPPQSETRRGAIAQGAKDL